MAARITKPAARLTVVKTNREHWGIRLNRFRVKYGLSERDLAAVLDYTLQKSAIHTLCAGRANPRIESVIKPAIATKLRQYLKVKRKKSAIEAERELLEIFQEPICTEKEKEPVLTQRAVLSPDAQQFFRLKGDPFTGDPRDVSEVFTTPRLNDCLSHILESVKFQGFNALIGEVGSGKTIIKRRAVDACNKSHGKLRILWPEFMNMEKVHSGSIASYVLRQFNDSAPRDLVARAERLKRLLVRLSGEGVRVALGFDECHRLDPRLLTALKNFWELGDGGFDRYIGLVLFGQLRFKEILGDEEFREISERLNIIQLPSLGKYAADYLAHRLTLAGGKLDKLFQPAAVTRMVKIADTPLALGNIANAALMYAYSKSEKVVLPVFVPEVNGDPKVRLRPARQK